LFKSVRRLEVLDYLKGVKSTRKYKTAKRAIV